MFNPLFYIQAVVLALSQIWANKMRSVLTTLGIIFGVWAVTTVVAALAGVTTMVLNEFESLGGSKMFIFPDRPDDAPRNKYPWSMIRLKPHELLALAANCPSITGITPQTSLGAVIQYGERKREAVEVFGIWPDWHEISKRGTLIGRPFSADDEADAKPVCLINEDAISEINDRVSRATGHQPHVVRFCAARMLLRRWVAPRAGPAAVRGGGSGAVGARA